jgi:hypothetical protein
MTVKRLLAILLLLPLSGCSMFGSPKYGTEQMLFLPGKVKAVWAVAPAVNVSGQPAVDPLLQADLLYNQLQQVHGLTVIPVNRVVDVFVSLHIDRIQTPEQAALVCDLLGADAIVIPTVTLYDPYNPPKFGAALQLMAKPGSFVRADNVDPRALVRAAAPNPGDAAQVIDNADFIQSVGMFDASNGTTRQLVLDYADGRNNPLGPMGANEYFQSMDRYCSFVYYTLIDDLLHSPKLRR